MKTCLKPHSPKPELNELAQCLTTSIKQSHPTVLVIVQGSSRTLRSVGVFRFRVWALWVSGTLIEYEKEAIHHTGISEVRDPLMAGASLHYEAEAPNPEIPI